MDFVLLDQSTAATADEAHGGPLLPVLLNAIAASLDMQLNRDVASQWGGAHRVRVGSGPADVAPGEVVVLISDELPGEDPGAVAYHSDDGASHPLVFVARSMCSSVAVGNASVSSALSHELCETVCDEACNSWSDDGAGWEYATEVCDPTEADTYTIGGVSVSNFALRAFFEPGHPGPWTHLGTQGAETVPGPFGCARDGYQMRRSVAEGSETQVNGSVRASRRPKLLHWSSRFARRHATLPNLDQG